MSMFDEVDRTLTSHVVGPTLPRAMAERSNT